MGDNSNDGNGRNLRAVTLTWFPMFIATLSLVTSIYNGYLNNRFVNLIQGNLGRSEYMRTCKEAIDAYFQVKYRAGVIARSSKDRATDGRGPTAAEIEGGNAVARFGALATYLANLRNEAIRARYTDLAWKLDELVTKAGTSTAQERDKLTAAADEIFAGLNEDCTKSANAQPM